MGSLQRLKNEEGSGCILAHCMGLGKTISVSEIEYLNYIATIKCSWYYFSRYSAEIGRASCRERV